MDKGHENTDPGNLFVFQKLLWEINNTSNHKAAKPFLPQSLAALGGKPEYSSQSLPTLVVSLSCPPDHKVFFHYKQAPGERKSMGITKALWNSTTLLEPLWMYRSVL